MTGQGYTILDIIGVESDFTASRWVQFLKLWLIFWTKLDKNIVYEQFCEQTRLKTALNWCDTNRVSCMWILTTYKEKPFDGFLKYVILCKCNFEPMFLNVVTSGSQHNIKHFKFWKAFWGAFNKLWISTLGVHFHRRQKSSSNSTSGNCYTNDFSEARPVMTVSFRSSPLSVLTPTGVNAFSCSATTTTTTWKRT